MATVVIEVDHEKNGFNPTEILTDFDPGVVSKLRDGQTLDEYTVIAQDMAGAFQVEALATVDQKTRTSAVHVIEE